MVDWPVEDRAAAFAVEFAVCRAAGGIAEEGSVVLESGGGNSRLLSLLAPAVLVVLEAGTICGDLLDLMDSLSAREAGGLPASMTILTGPSKTSDIEKTLVTGVHGPGQVFVAVVQDA